MRFKIGYKFDNTNDDSSSNRYLGSSNLKLGEDVTHDGACLYSCIAQLVKRTLGECTTPMEVRENIASYLATDNHYQRLATSHSLKEQWEDYYNDRLSPFTMTVFGGDFEIDAAAELYQVAIFQWAIDGKPDHSTEDVFELAYLKTSYFPIESTDSQLRKQSSKANWHLLWHNSHYRYMITNVPKTSTPFRLDSETCRRLTASKQQASRYVKPNETLRQLARERERRSTQPILQGSQCTVEPLDLTDKEKERLEQIENDHKLALLLEKLEIS